jgi:hypothetical protein
VKLLNLDEFYRASAMLNPKLTLLLSDAHHFVPVNQLTIASDALILESAGASQSGLAIMRLDQFLTRTSHLPPTTDLRTSNHHQLVFGFRIVNKSIVFY